MTVDQGHLCITSRRPRAGQQHPPGAPAHLPFPSKRKVLRVTFTWRAEDQRERGWVSIRAAPVSMVWLFSRADCSPLLLLLPDDLRCLWFGAGRTRRACYLLSRRLVRKARHGLLSTGFWAVHLGSDSSRVVWRQLGSGRGGLRRRRGMESWGAG